MTATNVRSLPLTRLRALRALLVGLAATLVAQALLLVPLTLLGGLLAGRAGPGARVTLLVGLGLLGHALTTMLGTWAGVWTAASGHASIPDVLRWGASGPLILVGALLLVPGPGGYELFPALRDAVVAAGGVTLAVWVLRRRLEAP